MGDVNPQPRTPSAKGRDNRDGWLFLAPYLVLFGVFVILPTIFGLWISLHDYDYTLPEKPFVGLDNYTGLLTGPPVIGLLAEGLGLTGALACVCALLGVAAALARQLSTIREAHILS